MDIQAFYTGRMFDAYRFFGAHPYPGGVFFATWAPAARSIEVIGEWNGWQGQPMRRNWETLGPAIWGCTCPGARAGQLYKYRITGADGSVTEHCDPYGFGMEPRPGCASIVRELPEKAYAFADEGWMAQRSKNYDLPMNIYEIQAGSWRTKPDGTPCTYAELAELLPGYARANGYTHIELMPLSEYPFDGSWGYQSTGFYAPTSRYGTVVQLCALVDACHKAGVGVILDFVPVHFALDAYGLKRYDGTALYEYPSADVGESEWGSCNFMHSRGEVRSFLQSSAAYWLEQYHFDGLRVDAVSRLLYWQGDPARGVNTTTVEFLKTMNAGLQQRFPTAMLIAEDSTNYPKVTAPVEYGGLGFDYKWDLGWMSDTLDYFKTPPPERKYHFEKLSFSMQYFPNEHYILPFSHDENVHGKATILQKMYGGYEGKFPQGRALYLYMMAHPGKKLDFMGNEIGQLREYNEAREQDWALLSYPIHDAFARYRAELGRLYSEQEAFWYGEYDPARFRWLDCNTGGNCACALLRSGKSSTLIALFNFDCVPLNGYRVPLPGAGRLTLLLDTDWQCWGGQTERPQPPCTQSCAAALTVDLPAYSGRLYRWEPAPESAAGAAEQEQPRPKRRASRD